MAQIHQNFKPMIGIVSHTFVSNSKFVLLSLQHHSQVSNIIQISGVVIRDGGAGVVPVDPDGDGAMVSNDTLKEGKRKKKKKETQQLCLFFSPF